MERGLQHHGGMMTNISRTQRLVTMAAGVGTAALAAGLPKARRPLAVASAALIARAATGYCPVTSAMNRVAARRDHHTQRALAGPKGLPLDASITIDASPEEAYAFWRDPAQLSQALPANVLIEAVAADTWQWSIGAVGAPPVATWNARIINDDPGKVIGWRTIGASSVISAGSINFRAAGRSGGTEVTIRLQYALPDGGLTAAMEHLHGDRAGDLVQQGLERVKQLIEGRFAEEV